MNWRVFSVSKTDAGRRHNGHNGQDGTYQHSNPVHPVNPVWNCQHEHEQPVHSKHYEKYISAGLTRIGYHIQDTKRKSSLRSD